MTSGLSLRGEKLLAVEKHCYSNEGSKANCVVINEEV